jgi:hypothetical protein
MPDVGLRDQVASGPRLGVCMLLLLEIGSNDFDQFFCGLVDMMGTD